MNKAENLGNAVLQDAASLDETQETMALLQILALGKQEVEAGKLKPVVEVLARLRDKQAPREDQTGCPSSLRALG